MGAPSYSTMHKNRVTSTLIYAARHNAANIAKQPELLPKA